MAEPTQQPADAESSSPASGSYVSATQNPAAESTDPYASGERRLLYIRANDPVFGLPDSDSDDDGEDGDDGDGDYQEMEDAMLDQLEVDDEDEDDDVEYVFEEELDQDDLSGEDDHHVALQIMLGGTDDADDDDEEDDDNEDGDEEGGGGDNAEAGDEDHDAQLAQILNFLRVRTRQGALSRNQLFELIHSAEFRTLVTGRGGTASLQELWNNISQSQEPKDPKRFPKVPSEEGMKLQRSGLFGANEEAVDSQKTLARRVLERELAIGTIGDRKRNNDLAAQSMLPGTRSDQILHFDDPVYSGQFSDDGTFFFAVSQDFKVRMYDTSNPYEWKHYKTVSYPWGRWTLTDASLSPDNKWLAYTSISSSVCIAPTNPLDKGEPYTLNFDTEEQDQDGLWQGHMGFGIWSIRFSGDGRELVAGTNAKSIDVYDIESRRVVHSIRGHDDDVNAVCFADKNAPHIIYSGSDDATIKVWDRRSMRNNREVGAFVGHIEGLTYIDSKNDGRYLLSNGKDQSMKLWDLRMAMSSARFRDERPTRHTVHNRFDYRMSGYDEDDWDPHPYDNSVVTFRGHKVLRTLIRCHFSPPNSTNSRYVYSGSADGKVYVWNLDATLAKVIDVKKATRGTREPNNRSRFSFWEGGDAWRTVVRDASWHPNAPLLVASAWNGRASGSGTCSTHSYHGAEDGDEGDPPMGRSLTAMLKQAPYLHDSQY